MSGQYLLCICEEEWCFCTREVYVDDEIEGPGPFPPEIACKECAAGRHVMEPRSR